MDVFADLIRLINETCSQVCVHSFPVAVKIRDISCQVQGAVHKCIGRISSQGNLREILRKLLKIF